PIVSATDLALVGQADELGVATVGLSTSVVLTFVWIFGSLFYPVSARVGVLFGASQYEKINHLVSYLFYRMLIVVFIMSVILYFVAEPIISWYGASEGDIKVQATVFLQIRALGLLPLVGAMYIFQVFKGLQNTKVILYATLISSVLNLGFDLLLIEGLWFFPRMGVEGAAYASLIGQTGMFLFILMVFLQQKILIRSATRPQQLLQLMANSANLLIRTVLLNATLIIGNRITLNSSVFSLQTHIIMANFFMLVSYFLDGAATAATAIIASLKGAKQLSLIKGVILKCGVINLVFTSLFVLVAVLFKKELFSIYEAPIAVLDLFDRVDVIYYSCLFFGGVAFTLDGVMIGLEKMKFLRNTLVVATGSYIGFLYLFQEQDLYAVWSSLVLWMSIRALLPLWKARNLGSNSSGLFV
ncbi:MATE family efflux transporter, partial [Cyclobacteriaceae bacterium]|nr:MATE family efflux transporter [Cyclobacteriaceae bacterium]